ncbi:hypothetical protein JCM6292_1433 [Bacteroides pyogenes JCM 6292]|uniref:Uncharacterized protein n=1 Tax=Bacteroides pyogenes JCM 6292 TaxID=1235809 RepID=W4P640_9BACE|nr:hypothetical protein JCM6292_1433 [Bacteroides pyogenes JCM 6292]
MPHGDLLDDLSGGYDVDPLQFYAPPYVSGAVLHGCSVSLNGIRFLLELHFLRQYSRLSRFFSWQFNVRSSRLHKQAHGFGFS